MKPLRTVIERIAPRILTQVCRDPSSEMYGCFDRNWWHYKMRDFPSIILQQGSYFLWLLGQTEPWKERADELNRLARAGALFWNRRATRRGAFEEYYPWEQGYPPLAFSTLAVMKLVHAGIVAAADVEPGARVAARQLTHRFERQAANQQVAGLAALAWLRRAFPALVSDRDFDRLKSDTLALQHDEGWFEEYGGPDLGYLSVTLDCLWDLADATQDAGYVAAARKALNFMAPFVELTGAGIGMHNSRNTDYIVPYGIARFAAEGDARAREIAHRLFAGADTPDHFLNATDDRYLCHYIGHSIARAAMRDIPAPDPRPETRETIRFPRSGHVLLCEPIPALVSLRKGGIVTVLWGGCAVSDFGWMVRVGDRQFVNHWWSDHWSSREEDGVFTVTGALVPHRERLSTPLAHMALRIASSILGPRLIGLLKSRLIFQSAGSPYRFERQIYIEPHGLRITDRISGLPPGAEVVAAPRSSKRHVASADSFHIEDLAPARGATSRTTQRLEAGEFFAESTHRFA